MKTESCLTYLLNKRPDRVLLHTTAISLLALLWLGSSSPQEGLIASLGLWGILFLALRIIHDFAGWRQGQGGLLQSLQQSALANTEIIDGVVGYSLSRSWLPWSLWGLSWGILAVNLSGEIGWLGWCLLATLTLLALQYCVLNHLLCKALTPWNVAACMIVLLALVQGSWLGLCLSLAGAGWLARHNAIASLWTLSPGPCLSRLQRKRRPVRLWSENPIVVREIRRQVLGEHGEFAFFLLSIPLLLWLRGAWSPVRLQLNGCLMIVALSLLQSWRTAFSAATMVSEEKKQGTLQEVALTRMKAEELVDGWAMWACRARLLECFIGLAMALALVAVGVHGQTTPPNDCTPYPQPLFLTQQAAWQQLLPWALATPLWSIASAYLGILAGYQAPTPAEAIGWTLLGCLGLILIALLSGPWGTGSALLLALTLRGRARKGVH